jgi:hypothetical protein
MNDMIPVLITWHFRPNDGELELDCFLECDNPEQAASVKFVYIRANMNSSQVSLLHIPNDCGREYVESWMKEAADKDVLELLNKAKVKQHEIVREKHKGGNAVDFLSRD